MEAGIIGGLIGGAFGVIGGGIGTYCSIRNTRSPREKAFMIKASVAIWIGIILFLALLLSVPNPYRLWVWLPYGIMLPLGITWINRGIAAIRNSEDEP